uniref:Uncharacterized protein n=1 Tax=Anguilla anguilla TaxID=7936 RepID=A0A0E9RM31_ANGAN
MLTCNTILPLIPWLFNILNRSISRKYFTELKSFLG